MLKIDRGYLLITKLEALVLMMEGPSILEYNTLKTLVDEIDQHLEACPQ